MKRNKKEDILLNTDNDDTSMLAEIQTDPDEVTAMEFNKEIPVMPLRNMVIILHYTHDVIIRWSNRL